MSKKRAKKAATWKRPYPRTMAALVKQFNLARYAVMGFTVEFKTSVDSMPSIGLSVELYKPSRRKSK